MPLSDRLAAPMRSDRTPLEKAALAGNVAALLCFAAVVYEEGAPPIWAWLLLFLPAVLNLAALWRRPADDALRAATTERRRLEEEVRIAELRGDLTGRRGGGAGAPGGAASA